MDKPKKYNYVIPAVGPEELRKISQWWKEQGYEKGDYGFSVTGACFTFKYQGVEYIMPPMTGWQGSGSWEPFIGEVKAMLAGVGCVDIEYEWGRMDLIK
jgi:hypothetical protein